MIINRIYENQNLLSLQLVSFLVGLRTYQHPCIYIYMCVCVCVRVYILFWILNIMFLTPEDVQQWQKRVAYIEKTNKTCVWRYKFIFS
jgi:hypothetical protein